MKLLATSLMSALLVFATGCGSKSSDGDNKATGKPQLGDQNQAPKGGDDTLQDDTTKGDDSVDQGSEAPKGDDTLKGDDTADQGDDTVAKGEEPAKGDEPILDEPKQDEPKQDEPTQDEPTQDEPKQDEPTQDEPKQDEPTQNEPTQDEPKQDEPTQNEPTQDEPKQDDVQAGDDTNQGDSLSFVQNLFDTEGREGVAAHFESELSRLESEAADLNDQAITDSLAAARASFEEMKALEDDAAYVQAGAELNDALKEIESAIGAHRS